MATAASTPTGSTPATHRWRRFVALGDSFTEGVGDPDPESPGGSRGWADRVAEVLSEDVPDFGYANLAVRGRLIAQVLDEQVDRAVALEPDLVTFCAGGNDVIRPGTDPDEIAALFETAVARLAATGATLVVFTGIDTDFTPVFRSFRGKIAIYNENIRRVALRHGCLVADQWALTTIQDPRFFDADRLHLNPLGHHEVARMVLQTLGVANDLAPMRPDPLPTRSWRTARAGDLVWARAHLVPWLVRRLRGRSSGDLRTAKRPEPLPIVTLAPGRTPAEDPPTA